MPRRRPTLADRTETRVDERIPGKASLMTGDARPSMVAAGGPAGRSSRAPGLLLGVGLGGFVDGILLHQVLQWHHLVSDVDAYPVTTVAGLEVNTLADGLFHTLTWVVVVVGLVLLVREWRAGRLAPAWRTHVALLLAGWGAFNLVEGLVDHHLLGIHHVRDDLGGPLGWDIGFLALSALMVAVGWALVATGERDGHHPAA